MRSGWVSATAAVLLTAGWAVAQAPAPPAIDNSGYSSAEARPVVPLSGRPRTTAAEAPPIRQTSAAPDPFPAPAAPAGIPVEEPGPGPGYPPSGYALVDRPDNWPPPYRVWASGDFLVWKIRNTSLPGLVSTLPVGVIQVNNADRFQSPTGGPPADNGPIFRNGTTDFLGVSIASTPTFASGNSLNAGEQLGGRFSAGVWLDPGENIGLESTFFYIVSRNVGFQSTTGNQLDQFLLTFPFSSNVFVFTPATTVTSTSHTVVTTTNPPNTTTTNTTTVTTTLPTSSLSQSFPNFIVRQSTSNVAGTSSTGIWGAELNARCASPALGAVSGLVGFRYLDFHEALNVNNAVQLFLPTGFQDVNSVGLPLDGNLPTSFNYTTADVIRTHNHFYGGQVGLDLDMYIGRFIADIRAMAALGVMHQTADVFGTTQTVSVYDTGGTLANLAPGGLLSSPLDQGNHSRNRIAFVPEINVKLGYQILPSWRAYVGYDFLYLSSVLRPGDQTGVSGSTIRATVANTTQQITVSQPTFRYRATDVTINGINFGMEFRY
jgi:hypothetical protein